MGDEYTYSLFSRLLPFADATRPGYLYSLIYNITNICGDGFYGCARILNALFFVGTAPFIYLTAKKVCSNNISVFVALLSILGPINNYTAYFMPEALYFFSFWVFTWFIIKLDNLFITKSWCIGGIILGLSALIKPHALFLLPAIIVYIFYVNKKKDGIWVLQAVKNTGLFVAFAFFTKLLIGYLIAGKSGLTILGSDYSSIAGSNISNLQRYLELIKLSIISIGGHTLAICLMFGVPISIAIYTSFNSIFSKEKIKTDQKISFLTLVILINLVLVVGLFTASVANTDPSQLMTRLHMRYYDFAFPLLLIVVASQLSFKSISDKLHWRFLTALPIGVAILYATYTKMVPFVPSLIDNPELRGFTFNSAIFYILSGISFISLVLWVHKFQLGAKIFIYIFMPLTVLFSTFFVNQELRQRITPDVFEKAGIFTRQYLPSTELSKVLVVGSDTAGLFRTLFYIDNPQASLETFPSGFTYDLQSLPTDKEWILNIGDSSSLNSEFYQLQMNGFTLTHTTSSSIIDFRESSWPGVISSTQGLSFAETWGTWSFGNNVTINFSAPLPEKFTIHLVASAFGLNIGKDFVAHVGDNSVKFKLTALPEEKVLEFNNPKKSKMIRIDIPSPTSPKELGLSSDERKLGIGFGELKITPL